MKRLLFLFSSFTVFSSFAQDSFHKGSAIRYEMYGKWKLESTQPQQKQNVYSLSIAQFFNKTDSIIIKVLTKSSLRGDTSSITIFRNNNPLTTFFLPLWFESTESLRVADFNADNLLDIKFVLPNTGDAEGLTRNRIVYLLQHKNGSFIKVSYIDQVNPNNIERDLNGDGNYEITTTTIIKYQRQNYWAINLYNFKKFDLVNVNNKHSYPILIDYFHLDAQKITNKIPRQKFKEFAQEKPDEYNRK